MEKKEEAVLGPFFNSSKHWHFDELLKRIKISRAQLAQWLKKFEKEGLIKRVKQKKRMPYYVQVFENPDFQNKKKLFALKQLTNSGLLNHLSILPNVKVAVVFGSFTRYDWHEKSDIDVFIYGDDSQFKQGKYELKLNRDIQVHTVKNKEGLEKINKLLPYIITGSFIKGSIEDLEIEIHARV